MYATKSKCYKAKHGNINVLNKRSDEDTTGLEIERFIDSDPISASIPP